MTFRMRACVGARGAIEIPKPFRTTARVEGREGSDVLYDGGMLWDPLAGTGTALPGNALGAYGGYVAGPRQVNARLMD
jgi:hypothetical protein